MPEHFIRSFFRPALATVFLSRQEHGFSLRDTARPPIFLLLPVFFFFFFFCPSASPFRFAMSGAWVSDAMGLKPAVLLGLD